MRFCSLVKLLLLLISSIIPVALFVVFLNISVAPREIEVLFNDADWLAPAPTPNPKDDPCCSYVSVFQDLDLLGYLALLYWLLYCHL